MAGKDCGRIRGLSPCDPACRRCLLLCFPFFRAEAAAGLRPFATSSLSRDHKERVLPLPLSANGRSSFPAFKKENHGKPPLAGLRLTRPLASVRVLRQTHRASVPRAFCSFRRMPAAPLPKTRKSGRRHFFARSCARFPGARFLLPYSMTLATTPDATVRPPSRMANRSPCSIAIGVISVISIRMLSPGITISTPSGSLIVPVTSVVRK